MTATVLAAAALTADVGDEIVVATVRDVHAAISRRAFGVAGQSPVARLHDGISTLVYAGVSRGLRSAAAALRTADRAGVTPDVEATRFGGSLLCAVNGLIGDRLVEDGSPMAVRLAVRAGAADVPLDAAGLAAAFPAATGDLAVFVHGLAENEGHWWRDAHQTGGSYGDRLADDTSWTPVYLRVNTGLPIAANGLELAALLDELVARWPVPVQRIALVGHSMGGLLARAACALAEPRHRWPARVSDVVTLGTPHLGAPLERAVAAAGRALSRFPESAPFARILEHRSRGILDLRRGLAADVQNLPNARYHLVAATLAASSRHPVSRAAGDLLVPYPSATGSGRDGAEMFPGADVLHIRGGHFNLLNHPEVYAALRRWLA